MIKKIRSCNDEYKLFCEADSLLVGLSGGADSVALALALKELGCKVSCAHINHCIRGEESERDEYFCRSFCDKEGLRMIVKRLDVRSYCEKNRVGLETGARELRYKALQDIADLLGNEVKLCTAHHADDNLETVLLNLARGTALKGLCGIPPKRDNIIRPLLFCTREEIEKFLEEKNQDYVLDSTNNDDFCARNKIRHYCIPVLKEINPKAAECFSNTSVVISSEDKLLDEYAKDILDTLRIKSKINAERLIKQSLAMKRRIIGLWLLENKIELSFDRVQRVLDILNGGKLNIQNGVYCVCARGILYIERDSESAKPVERSVVLDTKLLFFNKEVLFKIVNTDGENANVHKKFAKSCFDYDKIIGEILFRSRKSDDKIALCGRGFTSSVKKLLSELDFAEREKALILCDSEGVVFVEGFGAAQRVCVDDNTSHMLVVSINQR